MKITETPLNGLIILDPDIFQDDRGYFFESFQHEKYAKLNIPAFVQDNTSRSKRHVLRGLHYQLPHAQGKLVSAIRGVIWDVVVDIRMKSPTFGKWFGLTLSDENHKQLYIPPGFAHGFCVLSDEADVYYKTTEYYHPSSEHGIIWNDAALNIDWPIKNPILSPKDELYPHLDKIAHEHLFS